MNLMYMHYRRKGKPAKGGATVAIWVNDAEKTAALSVAWCSEHDVFNKKVGREIAAGRLKARLNSEKDCRFITVVSIDTDNVKASAAEHLAAAMSAKGFE